MNSKNRWPNIVIPTNIDISQWLQDKFSLYSNLLFLIDHNNRQKIKYGHVFNDIKRMIKIFEKQNISSIDTIAIIINSDTNKNNSITYEYIITILTILFINAKLVLFEFINDNDIDLIQNEKLLHQIIVKCMITKIIVIKSTNCMQNEICFKFHKYFKNNFSIWLGDKNEQTINFKSINGDERYFMADESAKNHNRNRKKFVDLGKISTKNNNNKKDLDTIILIIKFKAENHFTVHTITNYLLFSQLTYATLPECGFEWNMNDIIMKLNDKQENWLNVLTLLIIISIGSQLLINFENLGWKNFSSLIKQYSITSILMNSNHLIDLIKEDNQLDHNSLHSIEKILYYNQIYHSNFIFKFMKNRFKNLRQCRFFLYSLETSGVIAIELTRHHYHQLGKQDAQMSLTTATTSSIEPWPSIKIQLLNWNQGNSIIHNDDFNQPGYLYVHYADEFEDNDEISGRSSEFKFNDKNWIQTNYVGYYDNEKNFQIIDRNENILTINERKYSKTIIETIMMANNLIQIKNCSINQLINDENNDKSILIEIQLNDNVISHENKIDEKILRHQLIDNFNFTDQIVDKFKFKFT